jgi:tyrosine-specific transport protein
LRKLYHILSFATLITGTALGGGILGLPILAGTAGFVPSVICLVFMWVFMTITGWLIIYAFSDSNASDFATLYKEKLGSVIKNIHAVVFLITMYGLLVAYLSGVSSTVVNLLPEVKKIPFSTPVITIVFFIFATALVVFSFNFMRKSNTFLNVFMFIVFAFLIIITFKYIQPDNLAYSEWKQFPFVMPILVTAFGYQAVLPVLYRHTLGMDSQKALLNTSLVLGTFIVLVINLVWIVIVLGVIPLHSNDGASIYDALHKGLPATVPLAQIINSKLLLTVAMIFTFFAIITSYVGIGASLLNYVEGFTREYIKISRLSCAVITFFLPLVFVFTYPQVFIKALSFVGGFGIIIVSGFIPAFLGLKSKKNIFIKIVSCFVLLVSFIIFVAEFYIFFKF